jgi:hypothetical protein
MRFNMIGFVLSDIIARNRGVPSATALRDGLLGGVVGSPLLGVVLASVISQNQESSGSSLPAPAGPSISLLSPNLGPAGTPVTITGANFGPAAGVATVMFNETAADNVTVVNAATITVDVPEMEFDSYTVVDVTVGVGTATSGSAPFTVIPDE